ncbi:hypothetical protein ASD01_17450 [Ensifer sp. Root423]|nr:hypothetical protein ASD01_17450 [Ensifer sp. Root423]
MPVAIIAAVGRQQCAKKLFQGDVGFRGARITGGGQCKRMGPRQRFQSRAYARREFIGGVRRPRAERYDTAQHHKQVLHAVRHLADQQVLLLLSPLSLADIAGDLRGTDDRPSVVA